MPGTITEDQLLQKARELGTVEAATRWMKQNGYTLAPNPIPSADGELPPLAQPVAPQQGALAAAGGPDEDDEASLATMAELDDGSLDFAQLSDPRVFQQMYRSNQMAAQQQEQSAKQMFEVARERLAKRYAGPGTAEQLFSLSRSLLSPRSMPGFRGFLHNTVGGFADMEEARRVADTEREEKLAMLQAQYQQQAAARAADRTKTTMDLMRTYASVNKPKSTRTGFNPITGELTDMDTAQVIEPRLPTYTPQEVAALSRDPVNRGKRFKTTDGRVMEIK